MLKVWKNNGTVSQRHLNLHLGPNDRPPNGFRPSVDGTVHPQDGGTEDDTEVTGYLPVANNFPGSFFWRGETAWALFLERTGGDMEDVFVQSDGSICQKASGSCTPRVQKALVEPQAKDTEGVHFCVCASCWMAVPFGKLVVMILWV